MRVLWVTQLHFDKQTSRTSRLEMAQALTRLGHQVNFVVALTRWKDRSNWANYPFIRFLPIIDCRFLSAISFQFMTLIYGIRYLLTQGEPDILIVDNRTIFIFLPLVLIARLGLLRTKFVLDIRSLPVEQYGLKGKLEEFFYHLAILCGRDLLTGLTVITPMLRDRIRVRYGFDPKRIGIWSSGVSLEVFDPSTLRAEIPWIKPLSHLDLVLIYHGVLGRCRGLQEVVRAMALLKRECSVRLIILGDGAARQELVILVKELGLEEMIMIHSPVSYEIVPRYIAVSDAGIIPLPQREWWAVSSPLKMMEYLAMGKPVIATDIEAHRSVLGDSKCVIYIKKSDPKEIAEAILKLYLQRHNLKELGLIGRRLVENGYTWDEQALRLENYLYQLLKSER